MHNMFTWKRRLTEQRTYEDEDLDGGGEVPVGLLSDEALLLLRPGALGRRTAAAAAAVPPRRRARRVQELQPEVGSCCEIGCTVPDRRSPAATIHVGSPRDPDLLRRLAGVQQPALERHFCGEDADALHKKKIYKTQLACRDVSTQVGNACSCEIFCQ